MSATLSNPLPFQPSGPPDAPSPLQGGTAESSERVIGEHGFIASLESQFERRAGARTDEEAPTYALFGADAPSPPGLVVRRQAGANLVQRDRSGPRLQDQALLFQAVRLDAAAPLAEPATGAAELVAEAPATLGKADAHVRLRAFNADAPILRNEFNGAASSIPEADIGRSPAQSGDVDGGDEFSLTPSKPDKEPLRAGITVSFGETAPDASKTAAPIYNHASADAPAPGALNVASDIAAGAPAAPATPDAAPVEPLPSANASPLQRMVPSSIVGRHFAVSAIARQNDDVIEVRLDPPELGKITIEFSDLGSAGIKATVSADLPGTLDFLRRHADQLTRELERHGFSGAGLSFSDKGADESAQFDKKRAPALAVGFVAAASGPAHAAIVAVITTAYDRTV